MSARLRSGPVAPVAGGGIGDCRREEAELVVDPQCLGRQARPACELADRKQLLVIHYRNPRPCPWDKVKRRSDS
jgi:hypothetical protein